FAQYITTRFLRHLPVRRSLEEGGSLLLGLAPRSLCGGRRLHSRENVRLITKIFPGHSLGVFKCHRIHVLFELLVIIEPEAVKLVERAVITESIIALIGDFLLAYYFLFGAL